MNLRDKILALLDDKGELTAEEIAELLKEDLDDVVLILKGMEKEGLVQEREKGVIFKKKVYSLTPTGLEKAKSIREELEKKAQEITTVLQQGEDPQIIYERYGDVIPLMLAMSLIDLMMLESFLALDSFDDNSGIM